MHITIKRRLNGAGIALIVIALDQWSKAAIITAMKTTTFPIMLLPFFNLVFTQNRGVSFGLLAQSQLWLPACITLGTIGLTLAITVWYMRTEDRLTLLALALVIGGAIGNIIDRIRYGAVTDFLDFHLGAYHWPAFNIADSAIVIGVVLLIGLSIVDGQRQKPPSSS